MKLWRLEGGGAEPMGTEGELLLMHMGADKSLALPIKKN